MGDLIGIAGAVLSQSTHRVELSAQNVANMTTPGFKARTSFAELLFGGAAPAWFQSVRDDQGKLVETNDSFDLALSGPGHFTVLSENGDVSDIRGGQFHRDADGRLVDPEGRVLMAEGGGGIVVASDHFDITEDGVVIDHGEAVGRLSVSFADGDEKARPWVRQGMLEASNVSLPQEMTDVMDAVRRAEAAQQLINVYDDLMGRAISTFGQV